MLRILASTALIVAGLGVAHADQVYRYVDSDGRVQYSDRWRPGAVLVKTTNVRPIVEEEAADEAEESDDFEASGDSEGIDADADERLATERAARAMREDVAKVRQQQCKEATERYEKAIQARRLYKEGPNGERVYASDAEADAYRLQALKDKNAACGS